MRPWTTGFSLVGLCALSCGLGPTDTSERFTSVGRDESGSLSARPRASSWTDIGCVRDASGTFATCRRAVKVIDPFDSVTKDRPYEVWVPKRYAAHDRPVPLILYLIPEDGLDTARN